jgi:hypothetical protein
LQYCAYQPKVVVSNKAGQHEYQILSLWKVPNNASTGADKEFMKSSLVSEMISTNITQFQGTGRQ